MTTKIRQRVTEVVTIDKIEKWNNDIITIGAQTGAGKSYFIKNILYALAKRNNKKILMLVHRINCLDQFQDEIQQDNKIDVIKLDTYQSIENKLKNNKPYNFNEYQYIVCDEFHYFMSDASFNKFTDISLNVILNQVHTNRIFMSATGNHMKRYLKGYREIDTLDYELKFDYSHIKSLEFFYQDATLDEFMQLAIKNKQKAIFFIESADKAYKLHKRYEEYTLFNCSKSNKHYKYVNRDKIETMLKNERFEELALITTTCMDAGVNIIDSELNNIVCDLDFNISTLIQCIGRKRIVNDTDYIHLMIKAIGNQQLGGKYTQIKKRIEMAEYFKQNGAVSYVEKYGRDVDKSYIVYDIKVDKDTTTKKLNDLMYFRAKVEMTEINTIQKIHGEFAYCKYLSELFNKEYSIIEGEKKLNKLEIYLEHHTGQYLYKDNQIELIDEVGLKDGRGRKQKSIKQLNLYLEENKLSYIIEAHRDLRRKLQDGSINENRNKTYWLIGKKVFDMSKLA